MSNPSWLLWCLPALLWRIWGRMTQPTTKALKSKATAVCWVVLVSCTPRKAGCMPSRLLTQVLGADSVLHCSLEKLKVGGDCVYRWAVFLTQFSNVSTLRAPLWELLFQERAYRWPWPCSQHLEYIGKVRQVEILAFLSLSPKPYCASSCDTLVFLWPLDDLDLYFLTFFFVLKAKVRQLWKSVWVQCLKITKL